MRQIVRAALLATGLSIFACASDSEPSTNTPAPSGPAEPPRTQGRGDETTAAANQPALACEELGTLAGTSLKGQASGDVRSLALPLADRALPSRLAIVAVGKPQDLEGTSVALGVAENANYRTCTRCLVVALGCGADGCKDAAWFFAKSGTATLTASDGLRGKFSDVVLEEVKVDPATMTSTPVNGGACLHIKELTFDAQMEDTSASSSGGTSTSSSSGGTSTSSSSGGTSTSSSGGDPADTSSSSSSGTGTSSGSGKGGGGADSYLKEDPFARM